MSISLTDNDINYINDYINEFYNYLDDYNQSDDWPVYIDFYIYRDEWEEYIEDDDFKFKTENINLTISMNKKPTSSGDESDCSICFDKIKDQEIYDLKCYHSFHCECIEKWIYNKQSCPLCRVEIDTIDKSISLTDNDIKC
jgi:hypothetical protein